MATTPEFDTNAVLVLSTFPGEDTNNKPMVIDWNGEFIASIISHSVLIYYLINKVRSMTISTLIMAKVIPLIMAAERFTWENFGILEGEIQICAR